MIRYSMDVVKTAVESWSDTCRHLGPATACIGKAYSVQVAGDVYGEEKDGSDVWLARDGRPEDVGRLAARKWLGPSLGSN